MDVEIPDNAENTKPMSFSDLGLSERMVKSLKKLKMKTPRRVQQHCIPKILEGRRVIGIDETNSGKTAAFVLPILQRLAEHPFDESVFALVLVPTRDLANELLHQFRGLGSSLHFTLILVVGGVRMQVNHLEVRPQLVIATPKTLMLLLQENPHIFSTIKFLVLDKADQLMDGFQEELNFIFQCLPENRQNLFFSANMTSNLQKLCEAYQDKLYAFESEGIKLLENLKKMTIDEV